MKKDKSKKKKAPAKLSNKAASAAANLDYLDPKYIKAAKKRHKDKDS